MLPKFTCCFLGLITCLGAARAQLAVVATQPVANGAIDPSQPLLVSFSQPIDPTSVDAASFSAFGQWSGAVIGTVLVAADSQSARLQPARPLFPGERLTLTLSSAIRTPGGAHLIGGHHLEARVRSAPGTRLFEPAETIALRQPGDGRLGTYGIYAGDIDRDGAPDIVALNEISNDLRVLHNSGCGTFAAPVTLHNPGQWPSPNRGADFNRDGFLDLVTGNQNGGAISVYLNTGAGTFAAPVVYPTSGYVHGVAAGDFNGDGYWDIAAPNGNDVSILLNLGDGTFAAPVTYDGGGTGEDNVGILDADEDGIFDLVVGNLFSNSMGLLRGNGDGTFQPAVTFPAGGQPFHQTVGDCNGDGHADVLFANRGTNTLAVLFGDGAGGFSAPVTYPVGQAPAAVDVGDLDGDGHLDCVVANYSSADYSLWWNRGDGVFEQPATLPAAQAGSCSTLVDFDRDGILDIIGADENADVAVLYRQRPPAPAAVPGPSCAAALRIDQRGDRAGFGTVPPQPVHLGRDVAINLAGQDNGLALLAIGSPYAAGFPLPPLGTLHLDIGAEMVLFFEFLDANGERTIHMHIPGNTPLGIPVAMQALIGDLLQNQLSNPQVLITAP